MGLMSIYFLNISVYIVNSNPEFVRVILSFNTQESIVEIVVE